MPPTDYSLYFLAVIPPEPLQSKLMELKHYCNEVYHTQGALKSPAHITLHMPFKWRDKRIKELEKVVSDISSKVEPFEIELKNFNSFPPRVIFVDVVQNPNLVELQHMVGSTFRHKLALMNSDYKDRGFHPHVTIAFRDLRKAEFIKAWDEFKGRIFSASFEVDGIQLLRHNGHHWEVRGDYHFKKAGPR